MKSYLPSIVAILAVANFAAWEAFKTREREREQQARQNAQIAIHHPARIKPAPEVPAVAPKATPVVIDNIPLVKVTKEPVAIEVPLVHNVNGHSPVAVNIPQVQNNKPVRQPAAVEEPQAPANAANAPFSRRNVIVEAVAKTRAGVVAIRVPRPGEKDMIGTGFVVDESGLIVTNRHVTAGKRYVKVRLHDGTDTTGEVLVADAELDLAVVRIKTSKTLKALCLAPTADLMLGETVIAIGNPYGYEGTVSIGNISAMNREITMPNDVTITGLIQTTAPINPGNSGGPLLNVNQEVIGVNVALRDGAQNIAFAINATMVKNFLNKHFNAKRVAGIDHGIKYEEKILAEVGDRQRVVVQNAASGTLQSGDVILTVGDKKVANTFDVERALWNKKPGEQVNVRIVRQAREMTVSVTFGTGAGQVAAGMPATPPVGHQTATTNVRSASQR